MPTQKEIGKKIKELRLSNNISQERFGKRVGISGKSVSAYENGICTPSIKVMEAISNIYGDNLFSSINRDTILSKISALKLQLKDLEDTLKEGLSL